MRKLSLTLSQRSGAIAIQSASSRLITDQLQIHLSPRVRRLCWAFVLFFHVFNMVYCLLLAYLYLYMMKPEVAYYARLLNMMAPAKYFWVIALYAMLALLNLRCTMNMVYYSVQYQRLAFGKLRSRKRKTAHVAGATAPKKPASYSRTRTLFRLIRNLWLPISVRGTWFDSALMGRELVEIASQLYQAYYSSLLVSQVWMNVLFAGLICFNCVAGTLVHIIKGHEVADRRLHALVLDLALDFVWGSVMPLMIVVQYVVYFIQSSYVFTSEFFYADAIYTNAILEFSQFFITSWADAVTTILPYANMLMGLSNLKALLNLELERDASSFVSLVVAAASTQIQPRNDRRVYPSSMITPRKKYHDPKMAVIHAAIVVTGISAFAISIAASGIFQPNHCDANCKLQVRPWFTNHCACSVFEINCYKRKINGTAEQLNQVLASLDARVLNYLIISHCPALVVPSGLHRFPRLMGLQIYNATFVDWPKDASLSMKYLPRLGFMYIVRSTFPAGIPDGLLYDKSDHLVDIEFVACNIAEVPDNLDKLWPTVMILFFEHCLLQTFPHTITYIDTIMDLSLAFNNISSIPANVSSISKLIALSLDSNPLHSFPDGFGTDTNMKLLTIQDTGITGVPESLITLATEGGIIISAFNTSVCTDSQSESDSTALGCIAPLERVRNGHFPLDLSDSLRKN